MPKPLYLCPESQRGHCSGATRGGKDPDSQTRPLGRLHIAPLSDSAATSAWALGGSPRTRAGSAGWGHTRVAGPRAQAEAGSRLLPRAERVSVQLGRAQAGVAPLHAPGGAIPLLGFCWARLLQLIPPHPRCALQRLDPRAASTLQGAHLVPQPRAAPTPAAAWVGLPRTGRDGLRGVARWDPWK